MEKFQLDGTFTIRDFSHIVSLLAQAKAINQKIDCSNAVLDEKLKIILDHYNKTGQIGSLVVDESIQTINVEKEVDDSIKELFNPYFLFKRIKRAKYNENFLSFLIHFFAKMFHYVVNLFQFAVTLTNKKAQHPFQKQIMFQDVLNNCYTMGIQAIPIVMFLSMILGIIIALQSVTQLKVFGAQLYAIDLVILSFFKEMALIICAIILAARSVSSIISKIGIMRISDEWDAMKILGIDPEIFLLKPKIIALIVLVPFLSYIACFFGIFGGYIVLQGMLNVNPRIFLHVLSAVGAADFFAILLKGPIIGAVLGFIAAYETTKIRITSETVIASITRGVVYSIFSAIFIDMIFNVMALYL